MKQVILKQVILGPDKFHPMGSDSRAIDKFGRFIDRLYEAAVQIGREEGLERVGIQMKLTKVTDGPGWDRYSSVTIQLEF